MAGVTQDAAQLLREHGIQVTAQRLAVLQRRVRPVPMPPPTTLSAMCGTSIGAVSRQAVFDALGVLSEKGLIRRIQPARSPARYEDRVDDNHHHLVCRQCGRMVDVECAAGYRPCLEVVDDFGFAIDEAEVIYWGFCGSCQKAPAAAGQGPLDRNH